MRAVSQLFPTLRAVPSRALIRTSLRLLALAIPAPPRACAAPPALPSFVVFISDDHGMLDSQPYGSTDIRTPNMARLERAPRRYRARELRKRSKKRFPAVWARRGDWRLIRFFCDGPEQTDRFELCNLKNGIGETKHVAAEHPDKVKEFDALISEQLKDINAVIPVKKPVYDSTAKAPELGKKPHKDQAPVNSKTSGGKNVRQQIEKASDAMWAKSNIN